MRNLQIHEIMSAKDRFALERHRDRTFWGLLMRVVGKIAAQTFARLWRLGLMPA